MLVPCVFQSSVPAGSSGQEVFIAADVGAASPKEKVREKQEQNLRHTETLTFSLLFGSYLFHQTITFYRFSLLLFLGIECSVLQNWGNGQFSVSDSIPPGSFP
ncbi:hypothetical protein H1C71_034928 [Ictidomys tridecemlineatus]|nr:hypothetical protein H1C71_034928 [Ictidomys tridecemlineatus]